MKNSVENQEIAKTSGKAIASLILSILGVFLVAIPSIIGIILGHMARSDIKKSHGSLKGDGLALAGLIIGYIVVAIIVLGIVAAFFLPRLIGNVDGARQALTCAQMQSLSSSLKMFQLDNGTYPETKEGFKALVLNPDLDKYPNYSSLPYIQKVPTDSWGTEMVYQKISNSFDIISYGADKKEGGEDIHYSTCK